LFNSKEFEKKIFFSIINILLFSLDHCRYLDLRMNQIKFDDNDLILLNQLIHLTYIDISHNNRINELDLRLLNNLEQIDCSYNNTTRLILNGHSLKQLNASHNSKNYFSFSF